MGRQMIVGRQHIRELEQQERQAGRELRRAPPRPRYAPKLAEVPF